MKKIFLFCTIILISSCSSLVSKPSDFNANKEFDSAKFLLAQASGNTQIEATLSAKAEISNIFESKISSTLSSSIQSLSNEKNEEKVSRDVKSQIYAISSLEIKGLEIGKTWYDESSKLYYSLLVLDRDKARKIWVEEISEIDKKINALIDSEKKTESKILKFINLKEVLNLYLAKKAIETKLQIINRPYANFEELDIQKIYSNIAGLKSEIKIFVNIENDNNSNSLKYLSNILTEKNFLLTNNKADANVFLNGEIIFEEVKLKREDNLQFARIRFNINILDSNSNKIFETYQEKRAGHINLDEAKNKALKSCQEEVKAQLDKFL